jgi:release factor glutamine methyltransferase
MIISNPPYIPTAEIAGLSAEVRAEPRIALDGGKDGLDFYRRLIPESLSYLRPGGWLLLEIGSGQRRQVCEIFARSKRFAVKEVVKDYNGIERVIISELVA